MENWPPPVKEFGAGSTFDKAAYTAYEAVKAERDALKETDIAHKKRVVALEQETKDLLNSYQGIYDENKVLRSKLEYGPDAQRIKNFRSEIKRLEQKVSLLTTQNDMLQGEIGTLQKQVNQVSGDKKRIDDAIKMERGLHEEKASSLAKENEELREKVENLEHQQNEYENRIKNYDIESDGLLNRYKHLKRDNLKMDSKFKKQKDLMDEELRDMKEANKEMAKEIIGLKTNLAKAQSDLNSVKLDYHAAEKQIEYQNKELEVFKSQSSVMKKNVKITNREYNSMKEELKNVEDMLLDARNMGVEGIIEERQQLRWKEQKMNKRIDDLELNVEELTNENNRMEVELKESRRKMEAAIMEAENCKFEERALKRRLEVLENANIDLDRKSKFMFDNNKKAIHVTMDNLHWKTIEREKADLFSKCRTLEIQNRKLSRRVRELENMDEVDGFDDNSMAFIPRKKLSVPGIQSYRSTGSNYDNNTLYRRKNSKPPRSLPGL